MFSALFVTTEKDVVKTQRNAKPFKGFYHCVNHDANMPPAIMTLNESSLGTLIY